MLGVMEFDEDDFIGRKGTQIMLPEMQDYRRRRGKKYVNFLYVGLTID